jgi:hypothetical protein
MCLIITDDGEIEVYDEDCDISTYMRGCRSFEITRSGKNQVDMTGIKVNLIKNYINYIKGDDFSMTQEDYDFFEFMGHVNEVTVSLLGWKEILSVDRTIRNL